MEDAKGPVVDTETFVLDEATPRPAEDTPVPWTINEVLWPIQNFLCQYRGPSGWQRLSVIAWGHDRHNTGYGWRVRRSQRLFALKAYFNMLTSCLQMATQLSVLPHRTEFCEPWKFFMFRWVEKTSRLPVVLYGKWANLYHFIYVLWLFSETSARFLMIWNNMNIRSEVFNLAWVWERSLLGK